MPGELPLARLEKRSLPEYEPNGSVDDLVSQAADEGLDSAHPTPAGVAAQVELERSDEEMAALDATIASDAPPKVPSREQVLANLDARDAALEARAVDSWQEKAATWRERVGITQPWRSKE